MILSKLRTQMTYMEMTGFFLTTTYHPANDQLRGIVSDNWEVLQRSSLTKVCLRRSYFWMYTVAHKISGIACKSQTTRKMERGNESHKMQHQVGGISAKLKSTIIAQF